MGKQLLTALVPLKFGGKRLNVGEDFEASGVQARLLVAIKKAKLRGGPAKPAPQPVPPVPPAEPAAKSTAVPGMTTQSYKTRDLTPKQ